jgi:hypothetical protein
VVAADVCRTASGWRPSTISSARGCTSRWTVISR